MTGGVGQGRQAKARSLTAAPGLRLDHELAGSSSRVVGADDEPGGFVRQRLLRRPRAGRVRLAALSLRTLTPGRLDVYASVALD